MKREKYVTRSSKGRGERREKKKVTTILRIQRLGRSHRISPELRRTLLETKEALETTATDSRRLEEIENYALASLSKLW